ncbi:MAG: molybdopterin-dependent oxidoreductase [Nocardiaceae bacterium]|nr:molybdopterin-dependent oxidoreductase [Nocardiaceae bacterium]
MTAIGSVVVDNTPTGLREWAIQTFGTHDKAVLFTIMIVGAVLVAVGAGIAERRDRPAGSIVFGVLGVVAALAAFTRSGATLIWTVPSIVGAVLGIMLLRTLTRTVGPEFDRRRFLTIAGLTTVAAAGVGVFGRFVGMSERKVTADRTAFTLPAPAEPAPPLPADVDLRGPGLTPWATSNDSFYRIDTALTVPRLARAEWSLRIFGMVEKELTFTLDDLLKRPLIERYVTLTCVSNPVGGSLAGNAKWLGWRIRDLLADAVVKPDADMVLSTSVDGFTAGTPLEALTDPRDSMLVIGMNGQPLPIEHGYPARLVVPGLYGYVSATKWVTSLEVTRFDKATAYWTDRGWSERGPIKTGIRIDVPQSNNRISAGPVTIAGVAWAQHRGIKAVEVQIDGGPWQPARLAADYSSDTWRQWAFDWDAGKGPHIIRARATDGTGMVQTSDHADPMPDGATGWPEISVRID